MPFGRGAIHIVSQMHHEEYYEWSLIARIILAFINKNDKYINIMQNAYIFYNIYARVNINKSLQFVITYWRS